MPTLSAKQVSLTITARDTARDPARNEEVRRIVFVVFPDVTLLDVVGPLQAFNDAVSGDTHDRCYDIIVASYEGGVIQTNTGLTLDTVRLSDVDMGSVHTLLVAGGRGVHQAIKNKNFVAAITHASDIVDRIGSVCSGAFALAAAGLLDGRRAVTHWCRCDQLQSEYPAVRVERDPIYVKDGEVWTSAGITAGIDLALAMISEDLGRSVAMEVARYLVAYMVRPGGQSQFSTILDDQTKHAAGRFAHLHEWVSENLASDLRVETLADRMNMSARTFARVYVLEQEQTPAKMVEARRVQAACSSLENTDMPISVVSHHCGFGHEERMRRSFIRVLGVAPSDYRARFSQQIAS